MSRPRAYRSSTNQIKSNTMKKQKLVFKADITEKCIKNGIPDKNDSCPIALAIKAQGCDNITVNGDSISFDLPAGTTVDFTTSSKVSRFIDKFDAGKKVKPFVLSIPL